MVHGYQIERADIQSRRDTEYMELGDRKLLIVNIFADPFSAFLYFSSFFDSHKVNIQLLRYPISVSDWLAGFIGRPVEDKSATIARGRAQSEWYAKYLRRKLID